MLPYDSTVTNHWSDEPSTPVEILKACSCLEVLIRPRTYQYAMRTLTFEFDAESVNLPSLKRLEWWHNNEAERSGGINSLAGVLENAPNLEYLFVGGASGMSTIMLKSSTLSLPHLETLRLYAVGGMMLHQLCSRLSMPILSHVVVDCVMNHGDLQNLWEAHGENIEVVEFGKHMRFLMGDEVTECLELCPNLQDINYHVFFTAAPQFSDEHTAVHTVGLHAARNMALTTDIMWEHLDRHFKLLLGPSLPYLERVCLFGDWDDILSDPQFEHYHNALRMRHCDIECYD